MVKKVSGVSGPKKVSDVSEVSEVGEVREVDHVAGVSGVRGVSSVSGVGGPSGLGPVGQRITRANQDEVLASIDREAEKMFKGKRIPRKRQQTITQAIKMAVLAAPVDEDDETEDKTGKSR